MPEPTHITPVYTELPATPGLSKMPDHVLSILTGVIDSFPAGWFEGCNALFASGLQGETRCCKINERLEVPAHLRI
jgi:hypothetical protein